MTEAPDLDYLRRWLGREQVTEDVVTAWPAAALTATLGGRARVPEPGEALPSGWHWLYFLEAKPPAELAADGHPKRGNFLPPVPLPRRMWAGGRLSFRRPLVVGRPILRHSTVTGIEVKQGASGCLVFVTVRHRIGDGDGELLVEEHDLVYREAPRPGLVAPRRPAPPQAVWQRQVQPDPVLLFRFSALTFNGHRIHYDRSYAIDREGYPGLVVHGPLQAVLLLELCRERLPRRPLATFEFRSLAPLFDATPFSVCGAPAEGGATAELWIADHQGTLAMSASARFADR